MNLIEQIVAYNFGIWVLLICLFFIIIGNKFQDKYINIIFYIFLISLVCLDIADIADFCLKVGDVFTPWRYVSTIFGYLLKTLSILLFIIFILRREKQKKYTWLIFIPFIVEVILIGITPFTHWVFSFSDTNNFIRGPIGFLSHVISGIYIALLIVLTFIFSSKFDKYEVYSVCLVCSMSIVALVLESIDEYKFLLTTALTISCLVYFLYFYMRQSRVDILTSLFNRQCFFSDLNKIKKDKAALISIDLNGLKGINDGFGHEKGDEALLTLANCLYRVSGRGFRAYRTGGDEFMVLGINKGAQEAEKFIKDAKNELSKTDYMAAFGYAVYNRGMSFDECLKISDAAMYKDKKTYKNKL
jgi:diguanylate cyclase (GGDEF)-like protein